MTTGYRSSEGSREPWTPEKKVTTTFKVIGSLIAITAASVYAWMMMNNSISDLNKRTARVENRQDSIERTLAEQHDILIKMGANVDFIAGGRRGQPPPPTVP